MALHTYMLINCVTVIINALKDSVAIAVPTFNRRHKVPTLSHIGLKIWGKLKMTVILLAFL